MDQVVRYQEILRRLAIIDDGFVEGQAGLGLGLAGARVLDVKTAALVQVGVLAAIGSPAACLKWGATRALTAGATEDEITGVLLAIAPVAGVGRVVAAVSGVADAFGYDIEAALEELDGHYGGPGAAGQPANAAGRLPGNGQADLKTPIRPGGGRVTERARRSMPTRRLRTCGTGWSRWIS